MRLFHDDWSGELSELDWHLAQPSVDGLVSVIVPTYNRRDYILETLDSVVGQSYRPIELIVVDDGSTDDTFAVLEEWRDGLPCDGGFGVRLERQENSGAQRARNRGLLLARGEYVQFLDADDTLDCEKALLQVEHLQCRNELGMSVGQACSMADPDRSLHAHREYGTLELLCRSASWSPFSTPGPLLRRTVLEDPRLAWDERLPCCQDWEYFTRLVLLGVRYGYCLRAKAYIRPGDARVRTGTHARRDLRPAYLKARCIQLGSLWHNAPPRMRSSGRFRKALAWEVLRFHVSLEKAGSRGQAHAAIEWAAVISRETTLGPVTRPLLLLTRFGLSSIASLLFQAVSWTYYRYAGLLARVKRRRLP